MVVGPPAKGGRRSPLPRERVRVRGKPTNDHLCRTVLAKMERSNVTMPWLFFRDKNQAADYVR